jgi:glucose-1-phosphate thymidylyltransferase
VTRDVVAWEDCGNVDALLQTNAWLLSTDPPSPAQRPGSVIVHPSFVHREAVLENAVVGPHASIGAGTVVRNAVVRDAIVEENSMIADVVIEHSVVGARAEVSGTARQINIGDTAKVTV